MDKPAIPVTDITRVAGFAVMQAVRDDRDFQHMPPSATMMEAFAEREIKKAYLKIVRQDVLYFLKEARDLHVLATCEREDCPPDDVETWDEALDDAAFDALGHCGTFSANFKGAACVDTRLHDPDELEALASRAAEDAWKVASFNTDKDAPRALTARELLDMLGVTRSMIDAFVGEQRTPSPEETKEYKMVNRQVTLTKLHYAKPLYDGDEAAYIFDLEQATDTDEILAGGSLTRLGLDASDKQNLSDWFAELSYDFDVACSIIDEDKNALTPTEVAALGGDVLDVAQAAGIAAVATVTTEEDDEAAELAALMGAVEPDPAPAIVAGAAPAKATRKSAKDKAAADADPNVIAAPLLSKLKDTLGEKDEVLATGCGMSRATFNNYVKGKGAFVASDVQFAFLRDLAITRRDELNAILAEMGER